MKICMIGAGYVGLVSAACFTEFGWTVTCVDNDPARVARLKKGEIPIYEPGLDKLVHANAAAGRLHFTGNLKSAVECADVVFLAVGTPMRRGDGYADLSYIFSAVDEIAPHLDAFTVITTKSTVPVGTSRRIEERLRALRPDADFAVCSNPEFLREGTALEDFMHPDRILIGCDDPRAEKILRKLYQPLTDNNYPLMVSERESAELAKYAANAFLAMKISFINEIADLCERVGANVNEVASAIGKDKRIGDRFLQPGPGYGGSCFPKDIAAIIRTARENQAPLTLIERVQHINDERKIEMARRIRVAMGGDLKGKTIGVLGITFKPDTDDIREAPSLTILPILAGEGATIRAYDPQGRKHAAALLPTVEWCDAPMDVADDADAVVLLTEWDEFRTLDLTAMRKLMKGHLLADLRNVFSAAEAEAAGLVHIGIGLPDEYEAKPALVIKAQTKSNGVGHATGALHN